MEQKSTKPNRHFCEVTLLGESAWSRHTYACGKTAKVERDGKWYCGTHDPVRIKAKRVERDAKFNRKYAESVAKRRLEHAAPKLLAVVKAYVTACQEQDIKLGSITGDAESAIAKAEGR